MSTTTIVGGDPNGSSLPNQLVARRVDSLPPAARVPLASERTRIDVLASGRYRVQFTASASLREKLERLRDMLRSSGPELDIAIVVERAVTAMLERIESRRFGASSKPSSKPPGACATRRRCSVARESSVALRQQAEVGREVAIDGTARIETAESSSRYIPAAVRRAVRDRDGGRCRYVDAQGRRCPATRGLEFHHRHPYAHGGEHTADNLSLLCRAHTAYLAEIDYGAAKTTRRGGVASSRVSVPISQLSIPGSL